MKRLITPVLSFLLIFLSVASAQQPFANHAIPVGRGAGVSGYTALGPCLAGVPIVGAGVSADPICGSSSIIARLLTSSRLATAAVLPNSPTYNNGTAGVGATLTAGSNTTLTVDGSVAALNDVILVKDQAAQAQNGQYYVSAAGSGGAPWVLTRCDVAHCTVEFDSAATMTQGSYTLITAGSVNINRSYVLAATVSTPGATAAVFIYATINSAAGLSYTAPGTGGTAQTQARYNQNILWANDFGAVCNGGGDDKAALQHLIDEAASLKVPARFSGTCTLSSGGLTFPSAIDFGGVDPLTSQLAPAAGVNAISWASTDGMYLHDFFISYPGAATGTALTCDGTGTLINQSNTRTMISNVSVAAANIGLLIKNCYRLSVVSSFFNSSLTNNLLINNTASCDRGDNLFQGNIFVMGVASQNVLVECGGGQKFIGNKFNNGGNTEAITYHIGAAGLANSNSTSHVFVGNSIEDADYCFHITRSSGTGLIGNFNISGNELTCRIGVGVEVSGVSAWVINLGVNSNTWAGIGGANNVFLLTDGVISLSAGPNQLQAYGAGSIAAAMGSQITSESTLGPFAKGLSGGTWAASIPGSAQTVTCSPSACY